MIRTLQPSGWPEGYSKAYAKPPKYMAPISGRHLFEATLPYLTLVLPASSLMSPRALPPDSGSVLYIPSD